MRSRSRAEILGGDTECIYCFGKPEGVEHMPPRVMFKGKHRLSGMEYPVCLACNNGTRGSDVVAAMMARINTSDEGGAPLFQEALQFRKSVMKWAPGVYEEIQSAPRSLDYIRDPSGLLRPVVRVRVEGEHLHGHLNAFAAKLGLALYREHTGTALPAEGLIMSTWFSNAGLTQTYADIMLNIMPSYSTLEQGRQRADGQFKYRYNTDERTVVAALSQFHEGLYVFNIVSAIPTEHGTVRPWPGAVASRRGDLLKLIQPPPTRIHMLGQTAPAP